MRPGHPPYVTVLFEPRTQDPALNPCSGASAALTEVDRSTRPVVVETVAFAVDRSRIFADCMTGILLCSLPLLLLVGHTKADPQAKNYEIPLIYMTCGTAGVDARPLIFAILLVLFLLLAWRTLPKTLTRTPKPRPTLLRRTDEPSATYVDNARTAYAHQRFSTIVFGFGLLSALALALLGYLAIPFKSPALSRNATEAGDTITTCQTFDISGAIAANLASPVATGLWPFLCYVTSGLVVSVLLSWYAGIRWESKLTRKVRGDYYTTWLRKCLTPSLHWQLLHEQRHSLGHGSDASISLHLAISHWLRMAFLFAPHCSRQPPEPQAWEESTRSRLPERTFFRVTHAPIFAPLFALFAAPLMVWAADGNVVKPMYLPVIVLWAAWSGRYLARIALGTSVESQRIFVERRSLWSLYETLPVGIELKSYLQRYDAAALSSRLWVILTVIVAAAVGWVGAF